MGRKLGGGFFNLRASLQPEAIICGVNRKPGKNEPHCGGRPIVTMTIEWADRGSYRLTIRVLLDTRCTTLLLSRDCADRLRIPQIRREKRDERRNFAGELVEGAGESYSAPLLLRHRKHFTREVFEIASLELGVDVFLPFRWISKHAP
jgi:hypothetical protein